jgi:formylglycine-generating enzyme required for sulfatase activity/serine/threonine protein kinase
MMRETSQLSDKAQVFVSYGSGDAEQVLAIARLLEENGASVWRDGDCVLGGQYYGEEIVHAIAHSRVVLLMCSPHSLQSDNVHREVLLTWDYYHRRYIPVWLTPATEIPGRFRYCLVGCQWIDAHSQPPERWLPQLLRALKAMGVETKDGKLEPGEAPPAPLPMPADAFAGGERRGPRFKPGDRPIRGADWELERLLGKGGFGEVWKAKNPDLPFMPPVALKFCLQLDERSKGLLRHEADMVLRAQHQLRGSANASGIVPLAHAYLNNDPPCLEYPYIEGGTLVRLIEECRQSTGSLKPAQAQQIIKRIAQIVSAAHRAAPKLIHRDLKPSNILVERRGDGKIVLRVSDFGIGGLSAQPVLERSRSSSLMENMSSVLTGSYSPLYASPQQMYGDKPDPRDDVYALGVTWYQLLTGNLTAPAPTGLRWTEGLRRKGISNDALILLSSCVEGDPADRPDDAAMLADLLERLPHSASAQAAHANSDLPLAEPESPLALKPAQPAPQKGEAPPELPAHHGESDRNGGQTVKPARTDFGELSRAEPGPPGSSSSQLAPPERCASEPEPTAAAVRRASTSDWFSASWHWAALGLLGLAVLFGVIVYIVTDHGTVKIAGSDPQMKITVDGEEIRIENLGQPITFRTGTHCLVATRDGLEFKTDSFQIRRGEETVLDVTYTPKVAEADRSKPGPPKPEQSALPNSRAAAGSVASKAEPPKAAERPGSRVVEKERAFVPPAKHAAASPPEYLTTRVGEIKLRLIPAGTFQMGSPGGEGEGDEHPRHQVRIMRSFYLGVFEVTQAQYRAVTGQNPSWFSSTGGGKAAVSAESTDQHPVETVSWFDVVRFCNLLSEKEGLKPFYEIEGQTVLVPDWNGTGYRLPTEAEWEYGCRAGNPTPYSFAGDPNQLPEYAWYKENSEVNGNGCTHPVGQKRQNALALYDMHGNVSEWCLDGYGKDYYTELAAADPHGPDGGSQRVYRGGCWLYGPDLCRSAYREGRVPGVFGSDVGFRLALGQSGLRTDAQAGAGSVASKLELANPAENRPPSAGRNAAKSVPPATRPATSQPEHLTTRVGQIKLRLIPAGEFVMGSPKEEKDSYAPEKPQHRVRITKPFYLGVTEVTRGQFRLFVDETGYKTEAEKDGKGGRGWNEVTKKFEQNPRFTWLNPGFEQTDDHPVVNVSWNDAQEFIAWLSNREPKAFRLPTEAEWEYACRASTTTAYYSGDDPETLATVGNVADGTAKENYPGWTTITARDGYVYTAPVGRFRANAFGLYDMHGNVWEWCADWYDAEYYKRSPVDDPRGPAEASHRVIRGGCWVNVPARCRSAGRNGYQPGYRGTSLGFRLALGQSGG